MIHHSLFIYQSKNQIISEIIKKSSSSFESIDYIQAIKENSQQHFYIQLEKIVQTKRTEVLFILLNHSDASLRLEELYNLKQKYSLKIVSIFLDSLNSFEYIDRYYAQISELVIINETPYIEDFYTMLEINSFKLSLLKTSVIRKNNIFASSFVNLTSKATPKEEIDSTQEPLLISKLHSLKSVTPTLLVDSKFIFTQTLYEIYWHLYHKKYIQLISIKYLKYFLPILKLFTIMNNQKTKKYEAIDIINQTLYKEYIL